MTTFEELGLSEPVLEALEHLGYKQPTPIQEETIPLLLQGRDVIGQAQTGTGKTAAFGLPMLEYIDPADTEVQALVLTPTRELCIQVTQALRAYGEQRGINVVAVFGGAPIREQASRLKENAQVVVGTVGRVMDMIGRHYLFLDQARYVVLDEADEMLDLGFLEDVETILGRCPSGRQTALFSRHDAAADQEAGREAHVRPGDDQGQGRHADDRHRRAVPRRGVRQGQARQARRRAQGRAPEQAIIFARTKIGVDRLARRLGDKGLRVKTLHGDMSQGARDGVMIAFKGGREQLLVATDVAARGLDIAGVSHVVNYDIPNSPDIYVHRIGRTGRAGESGRAITFITPKQRERPRGDRAPRQDRDPGVGLGRGRRRAARSRPETPEAAEPRPRSPSQAEQPEAAAASRSRARARQHRERRSREREPRRPRHTKPRREDTTATPSRLIVGAGRAQGLEPADVVGAIVDDSHLDGEDVRNVRVLERFSFVEVPADRAGEVVDKVTGNEVRGVELRLEVAKR